MVKNASLNGVDPPMILLFPSLNVTAVGVAKFPESSPSTDSSHAISSSTGSSGSSSQPKNKE